MKTNNLLFGILIIAAMTMSCAVSPTVTHASSALPDSDAPALTIAGLYERLDATLDELPNGQRIILPVPGFPQNPEPVLSPFPVKQGEDGKFQIKMNAMYRFKAYVSKRSGRVTTLFTQLYWKNVSGRIGVEPAKEIPLKGTDCCSYVYSGWWGLTNPTPPGAESGVIMWVRDEQGKESNKVSLGPLFAAPYIHPHNQTHPLVGIWKGRLVSGTSGLDILITIDRIQDGVVSGSYNWSKAPLWYIDYPGTVRIRGKLVDSITAHFNIVTQKGEHWAELTVTLEEKGNLAVQYRGRSNSRGEMVRTASAD